jgi:hypothetical protein
VKHLGSDFVASFRNSAVYPGRTDSPEFQAILREQFSNLTAGIRRAIVDFAERFYRKVYPPDPKDDERPFDFSDAAFLRDYARASSRLALARGAQSRYVFLVRAEIGLYTTLHRLKARVHTSAIVRRLQNQSRQ